jgi:hypothetical protein
MITRDLWDGSLESWYWKSKGRNKGDYCGYCRYRKYTKHWVSDKGLERCKCPLKGKICGTKHSHYWKWRAHRNEAGTNSRWAKYYAKKIFLAIADHGVQHVGERELKMIEEVRG